jgi:hypothetical protein
MYDYREYFAEGVQSYFNYAGAKIEALGPQNGDGVQNDINTREKLFSYDYILFQLIHELFPCGNWLPKRCSILKYKSSANDFSDIFESTISDFDYSQDCQNTNFIELVPSGPMVQTSIPDDN